MRCKAASLIRRCNRLSFTSPPGRGIGADDAVARHLARFVCFQRWQHRRLPPDDDVARRDAANMGEAVACKEGVSLQQTENRS
eukprot:3292646-Pyramimonas_sp.AAC.1